MIDWFRNVEIQCEPKLVGQRWETAAKFSQNVITAAIPRLLRLFLFSSPDAEESKWFTEELLLIDGEFPVRNNSEILRLMAGVIMVAAFEHRSTAGNAFALGLKCASFTNRTIQPAQPEILDEARNYLREEADRQRPANFDHVPENKKASLDESCQELAAASATSDAAAIQAKWANYNKAVGTAIVESTATLSQQIRRLAEESALLWWVLVGYSDLLDRPTGDLTQVEYACAAAEEAADRTHILPPPPSAAALLSRALKPCKASRKKSFVLVDYLAALDSGRRGGLRRSIDVTSNEIFLPLATAILKCEELGDAASAAQALTKLSPGVNTKHTISPQEAARQLYDELMYLKALKKHGKPV